MHTVPIAVFVFAAPIAAGCGIEQLTQGGSSGKETKATDAGVDSAAPGITGQGCGVEGLSGAQLCVVTSMCPSVLVDTEAMPHCGFRIKGSTAELVCGCGEAVCSMGPFTTCAQAASLLASQTEPAVCAQVAEQRCTVSAPSSSGSSGGGKPTCDRTCLKECGGGAGCASICGC